MRSGRDPFSDAKIASERRHTGDWLRLGHGACVRPTPFRWCKILPIITGEQGAVSKKVLPLLIVVFSTSIFLGIGVPHAQQPIPCGPKQKHRIVKHKGHPSPTPTAGKALIGVVRQRGPRWRKFGQSKLAANESWVAVLERGHYTYFDAEPGLLKFCFAGASGWS